MDLKLDTLDQEQIKLLSLRKIEKGNKNEVRVNSSSKKSYRDLKELIISRIKRTKTINLDLTASGIDDNFLKCILPYIKENDSIKKIKLSMNSITDEGLIDMTNTLTGKHLKSLFLA